MRPENPPVKLKKTIIDKTLPRFRGSRHVGRQTGATGAKSKTDKHRCPTRRRSCPPFPGRRRRRTDRRATGDGRPDDRTGAAAPRHRRVARTESQTGRGALSDTLRAGSGPDRVQDHGEPIVSILPVARPRLGPPRGPSCPLLSPESGLGSARIFWPQGRQLVLSRSP
jgi:hypothetical protein